MDKRTLQRMKKELKQLDKRLDRISVFKVTETFAALPEFEKNLIREQQYFMKGYYDALYNRISFYELKLNYVIGDKPQ